MPENNKSFWTTLPGILTGIAAILTAITGLYLALNRNDGGSSEKPGKIQPNDQFEQTHETGNRNIQDEKMELRILLIKKRNTNHREIRKQHYSGFLTLLLAKLI